MRDIVIVTVAASHFDHSGRLVGVSAKPRNT